MRTVFYKKEQFIGQTDEDLVRSIVVKFGIKRNIAQEYVKNFSRDRPAVSSGESKTQEKRNLSLQEVVNGAFAVLNVSVGNTVNQEEIDRRASICIGCNNLTAVSGCSSCGFGKRVVEFVKKFKKSIKSGFNIPNNLENKFCKTCSCSMVVMLPSKMSMFNEKTKMNISRPDKCWIKKTSNNFIA